MTTRIDAASLCGTLHKVAQNAAARSNHCKSMINSLKMISRGEDTVERISDRQKLLSTAAAVGIETQGRTDQDIAADIANSYAAQFAWADEPSAILKTAPVKRQAIWEKSGVQPTGVDSAIVELMNTANVGSEIDQRNLIGSCMRCAIADGWVASLIADTVAGIFYIAAGPKRTRSADRSIEFITGFSNESILHILGGRFRSTLRPLTDAITDGRIRGLAYIGDFTDSSGDNMAVLANELIQRNVLVLLTDNVAEIPNSLAVLMRPEAAFESAGDTLREICEAVGIPPVLHMGSGFESSQILLTATYLLCGGGLGEDIADLPMAAFISGGLSEKAASVAVCFAASGMCTITEGAPEQDAYALLSESIENIAEGKLMCESDPVETAKYMCDYIEEKRDALGINQTRERKLLDMKERRELE